MTSYNYYVVENSFVARVHSKTKAGQRLRPDGTWEAHPDIWNVGTNGRHVSENQALKEAREIFEMRGVTHALGPSGSTGGGLDISS